MCISNVLNPIRAYCSRQDLQLSCSEDPAKPYVLINRFIKIASWWLKSKNRSHSLRVYAHEIIINVVYTHIGRRRHYRRRGDKKFRYFSNTISKMPKRFVTVGNITTLRCIFKQ